MAIGDALRLKVIIPSNIEPISLDYIVNVRLPNFSTVQNPHNFSTYHIYYVDIFVSFSNFKRRGGMQSALFQSK